MKQLYMQSCLHTLNPRNSEFSCIYINKAFYSNFHQKTEHFIECSQEHQIFIQCSQKKQMNKEK